MKTRFDLPQTSHRLIQMFGQSPLSGLHAGRHASFRFSLEQLFQLGK